jgi:ketosteroid isomerase-like protein
MKLALCMWLALVAAAGQAPRSAEAAIQQADEDWAKAVGAKSAEQTVTFYDPEILTAGSAMPLAN